MKKNLYFFIPAFLFLLVCGIFLWTQGGKLPAQLSLHHAIYGPRVQDLMSMITLWGDAYLFLFTIGIALWKKKYPMAIAFAVTGLLLTGIIPVFKHFIFGPIPRPMKVINWSDTLLPAGLDLPLLYSFPSGHTSTAFAFFILLALNFDRPSIQIASSIAAIAVAISRVVLMVHWIPDVMAGAVLGMTIGWGVDAMVMHFTKKRAAP